MALISCIFLLLTVVGQFQTKEIIMFGELKDVETLRQNPRADEPEWHTFSVKLDHHNPLDDRTWKMRYISNGQFFEEGGPIFIFLGGEWTIDTSYLVSGQMFDMASDHRGYMFYTEHRYYGQSYPTEDYSTENLKYLTTELALEDVAHFIAYQKSLDMFKDSKVVVVGKSYSATMATWMKEKYPHLVDIAYSSSAPLVAIADFYEYLEVVNDAINETDSECLEVVRQGFADMEDLIDSEDGASYLKEVFNVCDNTTDLTQEPERSYFFGNVMWCWSGIVQYAEAGVIQSFCDVIHSTNGSKIEKLVAFVKAYTREDYCLARYTDFVSRYGSSNLTTSATRQWNYQTCTEYGFYQTTNSDKQPFGNTLSLEFFTNRCADIFGSNLTETVLNKGIERTNLLFGALDLDVTKVVSTHGTIDPWYRLGILEDINEDSPTIVIPGASHRQDLVSADQETDSDEMYQAKLRVKEIIANWLNPEDGSESGGVAVTANMLSIAALALIRFFS